MRLFIYLCKALKHIMAASLCGMVVGALAITLASNPDDWLLWLLFAIWGVMLAETCRQHLISVQKKADETTVNLAREYIKGTMAGKGWSHD